MALRAVRPAGIFVLSISPSLHHRRITILLKDCLAISKATPLENGAGHKAYAPGAGIAQADEHRLVKIGRP